MSSTAPQEPTSRVIGSVRVGIDRDESGVYLALAQEGTRVTLTISWRAAATLGTALAAASRVECPEDYDFHLRGTLHVAIP